MRPVPRRAVNDLSRLLLANDLDALVAVFDEHGVDLDVFGELTDEDLREMGLSLGDRKRILRVQRHMGDSPEAPEGDAEGDEPASAPERRQITVLFADVVGFTDLSTRLDPEDLRAVLRRYTEAVERCVSRYGGHVAKYLGDGAMVYFGWPVARENDAERAVRTALDLVDEVGRIEALPDRPLEARVGVATGPVVIGDLVESEDYRERSVVGTTPNLAARLEGVANPGSVVISDTTRKVVGDLFELTDLGPTQVKGLSEPVRVWEVEGESRLASRFRALRGDRILPLVGRGMEVGILEQASRTVEGGTLQVVHLLGEAGIGKSRLLQWLRDDLRDRGWVEQVLSCSPYHSGSAFWPVVRNLEESAGIEAQAPPAVRLSRLAEMLAEGGLDGEANLPIFAKLLGIPLTDDVAPSGLEPIQEKEAVLRGIVARARHRSTKAPLLLTVEDLHWSDPSTNELLARCLTELKGARVLMVVTYRPVFDPPWPTSGHVRVELGRLPAGSAEQIVSELCRDRGLDPAMIRMIVHRTDGVPLFVEELTKTVLEAGTPGAVDEHDPTSIPETLHDSLLARLDRQGAAKGVAQIAACVGREFSAKLVREVADLAPDRVDRALERLRDSQLIEKEHGLGEGRYSFRHALVHEAAYNSLLRSTRTGLHRRIASALEDGDVDVAPEIMAHHYGRAGAPDREADYWLRAGQNALATTAYPEAIQHFTAGLEAVRRIGEPDPARELTLQVLRAVPLTFTQGWASEEVGAAYRRAHALCEVLGGSAETFPTLVGVFTYHLVRGEFELAYQLAVSNEEVARASASDDLMVEALHDRGTSSLYMGRFAEAVDHLTRTLDAYDSDRHAHHKLIYNKLAGPTAAVHLMMARAVQGRGDETRRLYDEALRLADLGDHAFTRTWVRTGYCIALIHLHDLPQLAEVCASMIQESQELGFPNWLAQGLVWSGWAASEGGDPEGGLGMVRQGLDIWNMTGARLMRPYLESRLLAVQLALDHLDDAEATYLGICSLAEETGEMWSAAETHRLGAEVARRRDGPTSPAAGERTARGLALARRQGALLYEVALLADVARHGQGPGGGRDPREEAEAALVRLPEAHHPFVGRVRTLIDGAPS